jgi:hypothetical protein
MDFESTVNRIIEAEYQNIRSDFYGELSINLEEEKECITPTIIVLPLSVQGVKNNYRFKCLLDSGSTHTLINRQRLPKGVNPQKNDTLIINTTIIGEYKIDEKITMKDIALPEFSKSIRINETKAFIFDNPSSVYDMILGRDFLKTTGIDLSFSTKIIKWFDMSIPMKPQYYWLKTTNNLLWEDIDDVYVTEIKPSKYEAVNPNDVVKEQHHLNDK